MTNVEHATKEASFQDVIRIDEEQVRGHVDQVVRATVEETLNSLLDEALTPVDRDVFRRQNRYYAALSAAPGSDKSQPGAAGEAPAAPTAKDEK